MRRPGGKFIANVLWFPALVVGALQMFDVQAGAITSWGADFFGPIALYGSLRTGGTIARWFTKRPPSPRVSAIIVLAGCVAWEICQLFNLDGTLLAITAGQFDPIDIAAYVLGVTAAFGAETLVVRRDETPRVMERA